MIQRDPTDRLAPIKQEQRVRHPIAETEVLQLIGYPAESDVILKSRRDANDIRYIIEVENDPTRKGIVGACLLADCSVAEMQAATAGLIFIVCSEEGKRQINNFRDKIEVIKSRCPHLSSIRVVTNDEFKQGNVLR